MGAGSSHEAEFVLLDDVPAGSYQLVADGIIVESVDVTFELIWRRPSRVPADMVVATWQHHFDPLGGGNFDATPFEVSAQGAAIDYEPGMDDQLVWRYSGANSTTPMAYIPNGDGAVANGRIPHITLPR